MDLRFPTVCSIARAGTRDNIFVKSDGDGAPLPIKLEICSGNGDWAVAQAAADRGEANWAALELRHDRVYNIFSRMVFEKAENLCVIGGDAGVVVAHHIAPASVAHVFINFPVRPPHCW